MCWGTGWIQGEASILTQNLTHVPLSTKISSPKPTIIIWKGHRCTGSGNRVPCFLHQNSCTVLPLPVLGKICPVFHEVPGERSLLLVESDDVVDWSVHPRIPPGKQQVLGMGRPRGLGTIHWIWRLVTEYWEIGRGAPWGKHRENRDWGEKLYCNGHNLALTWLMSQLHHPNIRH